ncbi:polyribonucleotide nucleotidyltransferase [Christensenellaceae bacterium NSJ-44]|uniref:Polyribonucleotide nucleotidyltransferase n=1 Tax=Luoshenia tenuis TaxID=2763654 RepID=A0A926D0J0_9FIRM|nr:polyribonucleotide nucleotidyltransferase [Luoshenia tenuis]MBC8529003.1 polyribonucleotide nucleotidyltransferase [Luoshenia tenuis]
MNQKVYEMELAGRKLSIETGRLAMQAGGSVLVRCGDTVVLVCATCSEKPREGIDFFPLSVDYEEKLYAVGKIPGGFIKREGKPTEKAILTSRLIDRPIRPLFPKGFRNDVHIVATTLSVDTEIPPDSYAMIGSSIALCLSDIPFAGPTGSVVVGLVDGEYVINPNSEQREKSRMHLVVSGTKDAIMMVEAGAKVVSEEEMLKGILFGHEAIKEIVAFQEKIIAECGKPKREFVEPKPDPEMEAEVRAYAQDKVVWSLDTFDRDELRARERQVEQEVQEAFAEKYPEAAGQISDILYGMTKAVMRGKIIKDGVRPDGRSVTQVRPIWCETGFLPRTHGSAIFTRGLTQVVTVATLGAVGDMQKLDGLDEEETRRYMHHYNMPPYSVGETKPMRGPGRREIGHGALAARALEPVIPDEADFPYAIRLVSEVISSNGSTSQASVCGSTLALMDAGVPIKAPVAGVAMGLMQEPETGKIVILTDIQGLEDFMGDMDFKVAGTAEGITAIQMDMKIKGIGEEILRGALAQAREGRLHILGEMLKVLPAPKAELSPYAPKIVMFSINPEKIGEVVGPRGKTINKIIAETGVKIDIEDDGSVFISTNDADAAKQARKMIEAITKEIEVGQVYRGTVVRLMNFGAFVELLPGKDGMVHISKLADHRVEKVEDEVKVGDEVIVKVIEIDDKGRVNLIRRGITEADLPAEE